MEFMQWRPCKPYIISILASASAGELGKIVSAPAEVSFANAFATAALAQDEGATLDDLNEAVGTLEEIEPIARRVLGGANPLTSAIEVNLRHARARLRARDPPSN